MIRKESMNEHCTGGTGGRAVTAAQQRKVQRAIHLATGVAIAAYVYAPGAAHIRTPIRFAILPLLVLTGIAMWQAPRIRRLRKSRNRTESVRSA
jgi:hypothetical protein